MCISIVSRIVNCHLFTIKFPADVKRFKAIMPAKQLKGFGRLSSNYLQEGKPNKKSCFKKK